MGATIYCGKHTTQNTRTHSHRDFTVFQLLFSSSNSGFYNHYLNLLDKVGFNEYFQKYSSKTIRISAINCKKTMPNMILRPFYYLGLDTHTGKSIYMTHCG